MSASLKKDDNTPSLAEASSSISGSASGLRHRKNAASTTQNSGLKPPKNADRTTSEPFSCAQEDKSDAAEEHQPSYLEALMGGMRPTEDSKVHGIAIATMDKYFRNSALLLVVTWLSLVVTVYLAAPKEDIVRLSGMEQRTAILGMSLIFVSLLIRFIQLLGVGAGKGGPHVSSAMSCCHNGFFRGLWETAAQNMSGILLGGFTVLIVAFCTDFLMAFFPTPVMLDPVLGTRVHVLRWCEWCPCTAFMTFMMEGADLYWPISASDTKPQQEQPNTEQGPPPDFLKKKFMHAATQGVAVSLGVLLPFCPGFKTWLFCITTAVSLYLTNFPRMLERRRQIPKKLRDGASVEEAERYNSAVTALRLRYACTAVWTFIVASFFVSSVFGPRFAREGSFLLDPAANMVVECLSDVLSKVLFLITLLDVHYAIFDPFSRSERRLEELRKLMSAVWESSSDPIAISVKSGPNGGLSTLLSPAFFGLGGGRGPFRRLSKEEIKNLFRKKSILFQLSQDAFPAINKTKATDDANNAEDRRVKPEHILSFQYTEFASGFNTAQSLVFKGQEMLPDKRALAAVADCVVMAWQAEEREHVFTHNLMWTREDNNRQVVIHSEAKASRLDENSLIVIIRDISERVKVFNAEKELICEATSRKKDAEANRFTRHEVKNGLLAAIGLYETLCEAQRFQLTKCHNESENNGSAGFDQAEPGGDNNVVRCMNELGKSLHDTLDAIMVEAMTRDLIHDLYRPQREWVDISAILRGRCDYVTYDFHSGNLTRFPLITKPCPLPTFYFDPILLRVLHRQVLSNACKFGQTGGTVLTEIIYHEDNKALQMKVINMPGHLHEKLVAMGSVAQEVVFAKGKQMHDQNVTDADSKDWSKKTEASVLPGEGGWIIQKCAKAMKGQCSIQFEETRTVFTVSVPAKPHGSVNVKTVLNCKSFRLPPETWGIGIDDSKIQQKLLTKFFEFAGIPSERIRVFGKNSEEIMGFVDFVVSFMGCHMGEHVLLIADENLDVVDEAARHKTISGSQLVESIRLLLLPEQERFLTSLIRSANDAASDVAIYKARAHGFLPKAPLKKENVLETLAHLWMTRYPLNKTGIDEDSASQSRGRLDSFSSLDSETSSLYEAVASTPVDILMAVNEMSALFANERVLEDWAMVKDKLHALKGDLLTLHDSSKAIAAVGVINSLHTFNSHKELIERWQVLREQVMALSSSCMAVQET